MPVEILVDPRATIRALDALGQKLPDAVAAALNRTTDEVQAREQQEVHAKFAVRTASSARFLERMILRRRGEDFANRSRMESRVRIEAPGTKSAKGAEVMLTRHIFGGTHTQPGTPLRSFFIPADATRPTRMSVVPRSLYPKALRLMDRRTPEGMMYAKRRTTSTGKVQIVGKRRTFVLTERGTGRPFGVYQREGPNDIQLLWLYTKKITIKPRFRFYELASRTFLERWPINLRGMYLAMLPRA